MNKYFVYILKSKNREIIHVGFTNNLERRLSEHNSGRSRFTRIYKPWEIVYKEKFSSEEEAIRREKYLKSAAGRRFIKKILEENKRPGSSVDRAAVS